jgi:hypothetical protein
MKLNGIFLASTFLLCFLSGNAKNTNDQLPSKDKQTLFRRNEESDFMKAYEYRAFLLNFGPTSKLDIVSLRQVLYDFQVSFNKEYSSQESLFIEIFQSDINQYAILCTSISTFQAFQRNLKKKRRKRKEIIDRDSLTAIATIVSAMNKSLDEEGVLLYSMYRTKDSICESLNATLASPATSPNAWPTAMPIPFFTGNPVVTATKSPTVRSTSRPSPLHSLTVKPAKNFSTHNTGSPAPIPKYENQTPNKLMTTMPSSRDSRKTTTPMIKNGPTKLLSLQPIKSPTQSSSPTAKTRRPMSLKPSSTLTTSPFIPELSKSTTTILPSTTLPITIGSMKPSAAVGENRPSSKPKTVSPTRDTSRSPSQVMSLSPTLITSDSPSSSTRPPFGPPDWFQYGSTIKSTSFRSFAFSNDGKTLAAVMEECLPSVRCVRVFHYETIKNNVTDWKQMGKDLFSRDRSFFVDSVALSGNAKTVAISSAYADFNSSIMEIKVNLYSVSSQQLIDTIQPEPTFVSVTFSTYMSLDADAKTLSLGITVDGPNQMFKLQTYRRNMDNSGISWKKLGAPFKIDSPAIADISVDGLSAALFNINPSQVIHQNENGKWEDRTNGLPSSSYYSMALSGDGTLLVARKRSPNVKSLDVFMWENDRWIINGTLRSSKNVYESNFGFQMEVNPTGSALAITSYRFDPSEATCIQVFHRNDRGIWVSKGRPPCFENVLAHATFGIFSSISSDGLHLAVADEGNFDDLNDRNHIHVYSFEGIL